MRRRSIQDLEEFMPNVALKYLSEGKKVALATVVSTWGSAPRGVGSQLAIRYLCYTKLTGDAK